MRAYVAATRRSRCSRRSSSGSAKAAVLPDPVTALPQMSRPVRASGMQAACVRGGGRGGAGEREEASGELPGRGQGDVCGKIETNAKGGMRCGRGEASEFGWSATRLKGNPFVSSRAAPLHTPTGGPRSVGTSPRKLSRQREPSGCPPASLENDAPPTNLDGGGVGVAQRLARLDQGPGEVEVTKRARHKLGPLGGGGEVAARLAAAAASAAGALCAPAAALVVVVLLLLLLLLAVVPLRGGARRLLGLL